MPNHSIPLLCNGETVLLRFGEFMTWLEHVERGGKPEMSKYATRYKGIPLVDVTGLSAEQAGKMLDRYLERI